MYSPWLLLLHLQITETPFPGAFPSKYRGSMRPGPSSLLCAVLCLSLTLSAIAQQPAVQPRIARAVDEADLTVLRRNTHPLALARYDRGAAPASTAMDRMLLVLKRSPEQEAALVHLLDEQQDKSSPNYHKWLAPDEFGKQFGPAETDIQAVTSWLQTHGFQIAQVSKGRTVIEFSGTAAMVEEAFHTQIHRYLVGGQSHLANASDPQIPSALTPVVAGVWTLHNFLKKPQIRLLNEKFTAQIVPGTDQTHPHVTFGGNPPLHALGPADYAKIYNLDPAYQPPMPTSVRIGVVARSNINIGDVQAFEIYLPLNSVNRPALPSVTLNGPDPGNLGGGEEAEAVLDTSWAAALLSNASAQVELIVSATTNTTDGIDLSELYIIDHDAADIMTESFGACEAAFTSAEALGHASLAAQAAAQGITYIVSSGDSGAEGCDNANAVTVAQGPLSVNLLASTPDTVAVGGTMFNENGQDSKYWSSTNAMGTGESALSYIPENVWNESCTSAACGRSANIFAGGGGASTFFPKPSWQAGFRGVPNDGARDIPDVSLTASGHDPYLICLEGSCTPDAQGFIYFAGIGGTSASAPSFAGIMALVDIWTGSRQGQANYVLYKLAAGDNPSQCNGSSTTTLPATSCNFHDVTVGNNAVPGEAGSQYASGVGYDLATGLGSVNITNLLHNWSSVTFNSTTTTITNLSPLLVTHGSPVNFAVTVTSNSGQPTGNIALLATSGGGLGKFPLVSGTASGSISSLPGGTYSLLARYSGDGTFAPSTSQQSNGLVVSQEPSKTTLSVLGFPNANFVFPPFTNGPYGSFVYLRADESGHSGFGTPQGDITFTDSGGFVFAGPYGLNSAGSTATPNGIFTFPVGPHGITASYPGDSSFLGSTSATVPFTITPASTTTALIATGAIQGVTLNATVNTNSGGNPPGGSLVFNVNGTNNTVGVTPAPAVINPQTDAVITGAQASASFTASNLTVGQTYTATVSYSGDSNYVASTASVSGTIQSDFAMALSSNLMTIPAPGSLGTTTLSITAQNGFAGTVTPSCSSLPSESTCVFSPPTVAGNGMTTLKVTTKAPVARLELYRGFRVWAVFSAMGLFGVFLSGVRQSRGHGKFVLAIILLSLVASVSCGGGSKSNSTPPPPTPDSGTPAGQYIVTVTATSGAITHTTTFLLQVQ